MLNANSIIFHMIKRIGKQLGKHSSYRFILAHHCCLYKLEQHCDETHPVRFGERKMSGIKLFTKNFLQSVLQSSCEKNLY